LNPFWKQPVNQKTFCPAAINLLLPRLYEDEAYVRKTLGTLMTESRVRSTISLLIGRRCVEDSDVERLRELLSAGGSPTLIEVGDIVRLERHVKRISPLWLAFFVEVLVGFFIWERRPTGRISEADIEWLAFRLGLDSTGPTPATRPLLTILNEECADPPRALTKHLAMVAQVRPLWERYLTPVTEPLVHTS
jgi:hypothetical protein